MTCRILTAIAVFAAIPAVGQQANYPYVMKTIAGSNPLGDGGAATQALLFAPSAVALDGLGNTYILDSANYRIRKVGPDGKISTAVTLGAYGNDMKLGADGFFYITAPGLVVKVSATGAATILAGTGTVGTSGDGIPATSAAIGATGGIALDRAGNVYFAEGNRVREITVADGMLHTIAGTVNGFLYNGDNKLATTANLYLPWGVAVDGGGAVYIADQGNSLIRKVVPSGIISTIAGTGDQALPTSGPAIFSSFGIPHSLNFDSSGNLYVTDVLVNFVLKISPSGVLSQVAGTQTFGYADGALQRHVLVQPGWNSRR